MNLSEAEAVAWNPGDLALVAAFPFGFGLLAWGLAKPFPVLMHPFAGWILRCLEWILVAGLAIGLARRRGQGAAGLGLGAGKGNFGAWMGLGAGLGLAWPLLEYAALRPAGSGWLPPGFDLFSPRLFAALFRPLGLLQVLLAPLAGEIVFRGFIYGQLKAKFGLGAGLLLQAALCLLLFDLGAWANPQASILGIYFVRWLAAGALYEFSGSLFPGMIYQAVLNLLILAFSAR